MARKSPRRALPKQNDVTAEPTDEKSAMCTVIELSKPQRKTRSLSKKDAEREAEEQSVASATEANTHKRSATEDQGAIVHRKLAKIQASPAKVPKNELTHLIPGYTAPLRLVSATAPVSGTLADLQRRAMQQDTKTLLPTTTTPSSSSSYSTAVASFKTGRLSKRAKAAAASATAGDKWFHMRPTPMTDAVQKDLAVIRNRNYLDPKRFYKSADNNKNKHMVQVGTVIEGAAEFYSSRLTKKERRTNFTDEILADPSISTYAQTKFRTMQQQKTVAALKRKKGGGRGRR
jgi:Fcf2 pre-rRNA processing